MKANLVKFIQALWFPKTLFNKHKTRTLSRPAGSDSALTTLSDLSDIDLSNKQEPSEAAYTSWLKEHPSALLSFERMMKAAKGKWIVVFLDYDGTLSPIVNNPDRAFMSDEMRAAVRGVAKYFPTAIISGRSREKVKEFVQLPNIYYAGSHGMDIMAPTRPVKNFDGKNHLASPDTENLIWQGNEVLFQPAKIFLPAIRQIFAELEEKTRGIPGARLEDNRFCISVHFREVKEVNLSTLQEKVRSVIEKHPDFHLTAGKKVMEIRPSIEWNKGNALEYLLETLGFKDSSDVLPLYIGDDRTDEDAFKAIESRGQGYPIIVSSVPKDTKAIYSLRDPSQVQTFLLLLARWRRASSSNRPSAQIWGLGD